MSRLPDELLAHLREPRHVGEPVGYELRGEARNAACRDHLVFYLRTEEGRIAEAGFRATGCPAVIGMGSAMTELLTGLALDVSLPEQARARYVERYGQPKVLHRHAMSLVTEALGDAKALS
jgi:nitrogen fixation NifU-like protein